MQYTKNSCSREEFCHKMGERFWEGPGNLNMSAPAAYSKITTKTEQLHSPAVFGMHHEPISGHEPCHQNIHHQPMLKTGSHPHYPSASRPVQYRPQSNGYPGYCPNLPLITDKLNEAQQSSLEQASTYQTSASHQIVARSVVVGSHSSQNEKPNRIYTNKCWLGN